MFTKSLLIYGVPDIQEHLTEIMMLGQIIFLALLVSCQAEILEDVGNNTVVEGKTLDEHWNDVHKDIDTFVKPDPQAECCMVASQPVHWSTKMISQAFKAFDDGNITVYAMKFVETPIYKLIERHCPPHTIDEEGNAFCCDGFHRFDGNIFLKDQCFHVNDKEMADKVIEALKLERVSSTRDVIG